MMMVMNSQQQQQQQQRQLVVAVEGTAALGPNWSLLLTEYVEKIVRSFCGFNVTSQKHTGTTGEMALIVYYSHSAQNGFLLQRSGWTSSMELFFHWLSSISFMGGGFGDAAVAEGLAEALLMCCSGPNATSVPQGRDYQKHCLVIAASNPHRLPTPVHCPPVSNFIQSQGNNGDLQAEQWWMADADTVAQAFPPCSVSLSILAPRQLPLLRNIFSQAKRSARAAEPTSEPPKQYPQHLVLLSEGFLEARMALHRNVVTNTMPPNGLTAKIEHQPVVGTASTITGQMPAAGLRPSSGPTGIGVMSGRPGSSLPIPPVTVKTEAVTTGALSSLLHSNTNNPLSLPMQQIPSSGPIPSQDALQSSFSSLTSPDPAQDFKVLGNIPSSQPLRPVGATTLPSMLAHSPSQSRLTIGSPSLPPASPLSGLQPSGVPVSTIMSTVPVGSSSLSTITQGTLGVNGQPGAVGMVPSTVGVGVGQGVGVGSVHSGYSSGTASLGSNTMLGSAQPPSTINVGGATSGQGSVTGLASQVGMNSSNQMSQNGLGLPGQTIMGGVGNPVGNSGPGTMIPTPGIPQSPGQVQAHGVNNTGVAAPVHTSSTTGTPPQQPANNSMKYTRLWDGILAGSRKGNPIFICKLEGYRQTSSPETLAADWPSTMQIMRLIPQDYMNQRDYQRKAELLVFRPTTPHDFLVQLAEKKLCAVIQLPSQTLLLASTDKPGRMIGMLFPGDMVQIKPQISSQPQTASGGTAPQGIAPNFSQNQLQGQLQNQLPNSQLPNQLPNQQPRSQMLPGTTSIHNTGFLP